MARRTPHHAERPQDRRVPLTPQFGEPPPSESPGSRVPPQCDFRERSGQHEPRKAPGSRGAPQRRHFLQARCSHRLPKHLSPAKAPQRAPLKAPGAGCLRSAISGSAADSMSRGKYPAHGALPIEGTLPFIGGPPSPKPTGFRTNPMGTFPPCEKPVGPAKSPSTPLPRERPGATGKSGATTRRQPWPIPSSNESGNTPSTRA